MSAETPNGRPFDHVIAAVNAAAEDIELAARQLALGARLAAQQGAGDVVQTIAEDYIPDFFEYVKRRGDPAGGVKAAEAMVRELGPEREGKGCGALRAQAIKCWHEGVAALLSQGQGDRAREIVRDAVVSAGTPPAIRVAADTIAFGPGGILNAPVSRLG